MPLTRQRAQKFAFPAGLSVSYPDEFRPGPDAVGGARADQEDYRNQIGNLHIDFPDPTPIRFESLAGLLLQPCSVARRLRYSWLSGFRLQ